MDKWTPRLLELGLKGIMGKGGRGPAIRAELQKHTAVYMAALGGGGALSALTRSGAGGHRVRGPADRGDPADGARGLPGLGRERLPRTRLLRRDDQALAEERLLPEALHVPTDEWAGENGGG
jgi:hypothetical protein